MRLTLAFIPARMFAPAAEAVAGADAGAAAAAAAGGDDAAKAAADAAAKTAADAAAASKAGDAGKTPEQLAAEATAAAGKATTAPDKYTLKFPEQGPFDAEADLEGYSARGKALGLSNEALQTLVDQDVANHTRATEAWLNETRTDPELGGTRFNETVGLARKGLEDLFPVGSPGGDLVRNWFERSGLGNHKEFVRAMARHGRRVSPDSGAGHAVAGGGGGQKDEAQAARDRLFPKTAGVKGS